MKAMPITSQTQTQMTWTCQSQMVAITSHSKWNWAPGQSSVSKMSETMGCGSIPAHPDSQGWAGGTKRIKGSWDDQIHFESKMALNAVWTPLLHFKPDDHPKIKCSNKRTIYRTYSYDHMVQGIRYKYRRQEERSKSWTALKSPSLVPDPPYC